MIGETLAHYKLLGRLGKGGMGEVYRARDTKLKRDVALKVLPAEMATDPSWLERFQREAETVAQLSHPHIVTLFSIEDADGVRFLTMELVEGRSLEDLLASEELPFAQILDIAVQTADALAAAHDKGIVHRDLKPQNIIVTPEGRAKVLDFGLAKPAATPSPDDETVVPVTRAGSVLGTIPYMSPEQLRAQPVDHRSDIFSLGTVLYELATGTRPFRGGSDSDIVSAILRDTPRPLTKENPSLPEPLGTIVGRCLEKDPDKRYPSARHVREDLEKLRMDSNTLDVPAARPMRGLGKWALVPVLLILALVLWQLVPTNGSSPEDIQVAERNDAVVVLPFDNLGNPEDDYFAEGVLDEIVSRLTSIRGMAVIARTTALNYERGGKSFKDIGRELGVTYVLEGTIRWDRSGDVARVRITPQLVRVQDGVSIWSSTFDREFVDLFKVQAEIAGHVAGSIDGSLVPKDSEPISLARTTNMEAYDYYLQSRKFTPWGMGPTESDLTRGIELLRKAIALDPQFSLAHADLSRALSASSTRDFGSPQDIQEAEQAAEAALGLTPHLAEAHLAKGLVYYRGRKDYGSALAELEKARELSPGSGEILSWMGTIRKRQGRFEEAAEIMERAALLDPGNPTVHGELAVVYRCLGHYDRALASNRRAIDLQPGFPSKYFGAKIQFSWTGDLSSLRKVLEEYDGPVDHPVQWAQLLYLERDYDGIQDFNSNSTRPAGLALSCVGAQALNSSGKENQAAAMAARAIQAHPASPQETIKNELVRAALLALAGDSTEARSLVQGLLQRLNQSQDVLSSTVYFYEVAGIHVLLGDEDVAVELLKECVQKNKDFSGPVLSVSPQWDPLRTRGDFKTLLN